MPPTWSQSDPYTYKVINMVCFMSLVVLKPYPLIIKVLQAQYLDFSKIQIFQKSLIFGQVGTKTFCYLDYPKITQGSFLKILLTVFGQTEK